MKKLDSIGRITLPKEIRDRNGFKQDDMFEIYERGDEVILRPFKSNYSINEEQMDVIRKFYNMVKDTDLLEENELDVLKDVCKCTDTVCPKCKAPLFLTKENTYKCISCGE